MNCQFTYPRIKHYTSTKSFNETEISDFLEIFTFKVIDIVQLIRYIMLVILHSLGDPT